MSVQLAIIPVVFLCKIHPCFCVAKSYFIWPWPLTLPFCLLQLASTFRVKPMMPQASAGLRHMPPQENLYGKGQRPGHNHWTSVLRKDRHWERGQYICPVPECQKVFSFSTSMYRHKRLVHNIRGKPRSIMLAKTSEKDVWSTGVQSCHWTMNNVWIQLLCAPCFVKYLGRPE